MDLLQLQYFRTIARYENLTKAAQVLFVTQPNLSSSITRLEEDLGVSLFDRRKGKIVLTPNGKLFLEYVDRSLSELDAGVERVRAEVQTASNHIRVAGSIIDLMSDIVLRFYGDNKDVYFKQINCPNNEVFDKVLNGEVDFGFVFGSPEASELEYLLMDSCERVVLLHSEHPLSGCKSISLSQLAGERLICSRSRDDDVFLKELEHYSACRFNVFFECNDLQLEINLITAGQGISITPLTNYLKFIRKNPSLPLRCVRLEQPLPEVQIGMVRRRGCRLSEAAFEFYQHVDEFFKEENRITNQFYEN